MALTFTRAIPVVGGEPVASKNLKSLALAFNSRLRSGVADGPYRIIFYLLNLFRQVRRPLDDAWPSMAEFFEFYAHLDRDISSDEWPVTGPGEDEGANLANPMMAFVFGDPGANSEAERLALCPLWFAGEFGLSGAPNGIRERWLMGKLQRGAFDPATGCQVAPAVTVAQSHFRIVQAVDSPHGRGYGGYDPIPEKLGDCTYADGSTTPNYQITFTPLASPSYVYSTFPDGHSDAFSLSDPKLYAGSCPEGSFDAEASHVRYVARQPLAYYVFLNSGQVDRLPVKEWIEGPYSGGGVLTKTDGGHLSRVLNTFVKEFRGSTTDRAQSDFNVMEKGFDTERFLQSQYFLAPAYGEMSGYTAEAGCEISTEYPVFQFLGTDGLTRAIGDFAKLTTPATMATELEFHQGFVLAGAYFSATKLEPLSHVQIDVLSSGVSLRVVELIADAEGDAEQVIWFETAERPEPLKFQLASALTFQDSTGELTIECAELLEYKPEHHDIYALLRLSAIKGNLVADGTGREEAQAKAIGDSYFEHGMILNSAVAGLAGPVDAVNDNAVYDAARRLARDHVRIVPRDQFAGYEVVGGKSILYFTRYARGNTELDSFKDIAPSLAEIALDPDADGIRAVAPAEGTTNEWLMFTQLKCYKDVEDSIFKPEAYSDFFPLNERCHFASPYINQSRNSSLLRHFSFGQQAGLNLGPLYAEAPTGYRYAIGGNPSGELGTIGDSTGLNAYTNTFEDQSDPETEASKLEREIFYRSCPIYEPDNEIESATYDVVNDRVKLVFKTRFQHCAVAPSSIPLAVGEWNLAALHAEPYRTTENGLREYLVKQTFGDNCTTKVGDAAAESQIWFSATDPYGACYPHFFFTHLVPLPFEDTPDNDTVQSSDTRITMDVMEQCELYLRAMCEGYIDGRTSKNYACLTGISALYDYTLENLCFEAFGGRSITMLPASLRADKPIAYGILPNTGFYAEVFNQYVSAVNLLTQARLMLPAQLECRQLDYQGSIAVTPDWPPGALCNSASVNKAVWSGTPPGVNESLPAGPWLSCQVTTIAGSVSGGFSNIGPSGNVCYGATTEFFMSTAQVDTEYQFRLYDPVAINALSDDLQALIAAGGIGFYGYYQVTTSIPTKTLVATLPESEICRDDLPYFWDAGTGDGYKFEDVVTVSPLECVPLTKGVLSSGSVPPGGDFFVGTTSTPLTDCFNQSSIFKFVTVQSLNPVSMIVVPLT